MPDGSPLVPLEARIRDRRRGGADTGCIFCDADPAAPSRRRRSILVRGRVAFVILNLYPYNNGHLMVVPSRHVASLASPATDDELAELMRFTRDAEMALNEAYQPQGINVGINLGRAAGAGIVDHLHIHLVPRWNGDTNFMSVIGERSRAARGSRRDRHAAAADLRAPDARDASSDYGAR